MADIALTTSFSLINSASNSREISVLSKLDLISVADKHLKELHFFNAMAKLEPHPSLSHVSEVFVPVCSD